MPLSVQSDLLYPVYLANSQASTLNKASMRAARLLCVESVD